MQNDRIFLGKLSIAIEIMTAKLKCWITFHWFYWFAFMSNYVQLKKEKFGQIENDKIEGWKVKSHKQQHHIVCLFNENSILEITTKDENLGNWKICMFQFSNANKKCSSIWLWLSMETSIEPTTFKQWNLWEPSAHYMYWKEQHFHLDLMSCWFSFYQWK